MPKKKMRSGLKKRVQVNAKGRVKTKSANRRHNLGGNKSANMKRRRRLESCTNKAAQAKLRKIYIDN